MSGNEKITMHPSELTELMKTDLGKYGLGYLRMKDSLPTLKSMNYACSYIQAGIGSNTELQERNIAVTPNIIR